MTVSDIIKRVRWCVDEEAVNDADLVLSDENIADDKTMDNIIKSHVVDALRWCLLNADSDMLTSDKGAGTAIDADMFETEVISGSSIETGTPSRIELPDGFMRMVRIRLPEWKKAVTKVIEEDSDEYSMLTEGTAVATNDRPVVALVRTKPMKLELWPGLDGSGGDIPDLTLSFVKNPSEAEISEDTSGSTEISIPIKLQSAFIYYLAFLLESAYADTTRANAMLGIAKMHAGITGQ